MDSMGGIAAMVNTGLENLSSKTDSLTEKMAEVATMEDDDQMVAMLQLQFEMGQYNSLVELTSSITSSLSDSLKSISQKV